MLLAELVVAELVVLTQVLILQLCMEQMGLVAVVEHQVVSVAVEESVGLEG